MDKPFVKRSNKLQRPPITEYIKGRAKLEDYVSKEKIITSHDRHSKQALLASINSIADKPRSRKKEKIVVDYGKTSSTRSNYSHSKHETMKAGSSSSSLRSERSAQGDTSESNNKAFSSVTTVSKSNSIKLDRLLNEKEEEAVALREEIENLKQQLSIKDEQNELDVISMLQKLVDDLSISDENTIESYSTNRNVLSERLCTGVQDLRASHETWKLKNAENEEKLAQFRAANESLQQRVAALEDDIQKIIEEREHQQRQLLDLQTQNDRLRKDLEVSRKTHATGLEMCTKLQRFIQHEFKDKLHKLQSYDQTLTERAEQVAHAFDQLEKICRRHIRTLQQMSIPEIERLKAIIQESEAAKMQQVSQIAHEYIDQGKQNDELNHTNEMLLKDVKQYQAFIVKLTDDNRGLRKENKHLQRKNDILEKACNEEIKQLTAKEKLETIATLRRQTYDVEKAFSQDLIDRIEETRRVTSGSNDK